MRYTKPKTCPYTVCLFNAALMEHGLHTPRPSMDIVKCTTTNLGTKGIKLPKPRALMGDNHYGLCNVITWGKSTCCVKEFMLAAYAVYKDITLKECVLTLRSPSPSPSLVSTPRPPKRWSFPSHC